MSQSSFNPPSTRTWRDIPQSVTPRAMSREGKKRLALAIGNIVGIVLVLGAATWGVIEIVSLWETNPKRITAPTKGVPVRDYTVRTDGVLDKAWVVRTLELPRDASLMELDLADLKRRLEASGQVSKAVVERKFPDVLVVTLQERTPVARAVATAGDVAPVEFLVARDGMVYSGSGYDTAMTGGLPFLAGITLIREGSGFVRIEGMEPVADLLGTAQVSAPDIYRSFKVVSLARFARDRTLAVKSTEVDEITFGSSQDSFYRQIARLDYILQETRRQNLSGPLKSINLAIGDKQVPVLFGENAAATAGRSSSVTSYNQPAPAPASGLFSLPPRNSSPTKRDF